MRIAVLEDDLDQLALIRSVIVSLGYGCEAFSSGRLMLRALRRDSFDLFLLDWSVPDLSGMEVLKWVRAKKNENHIPVLFITNRVEERDIVEALGAGADDYMCKPVRIPELLARIRALLRRAYPSLKKDVYVVGGHKFNYSERTLDVKGERVDIKGKEFELAYILFTNIGRLLSRKYLLEAVWGIEGDVNSRTLNTHISRLRITLNLRPDNGYRLSSVYSMGYRLESLTSDASTDTGDETHSEVDE